MTDPDSVLSIPRSRFPVPRSLCSSRPRRLCGAPGVRSAHKIQQFRRLRMTSSRLLPFVVLALGVGACGGGGTTPKATGVDCGDAPSPWTSGAGAVTLTVDGASPGATWSRFYEGAVATDHANTILSAAWGRNAQNALKKGHDQAGFRYARFHGILNRDIGVY